MPTSMISYLGLKSLELRIIYQTGLEGDSAGLRIKVVLELQKMVMGVVVL